MTTHRSRVRRAALAIALAAASVVLAACGGDEDEASGTPSNTAGRSASQAVDDAHNAQDVQFAQGMIPHHRQAVDMADLAPGRAASKEVKDLAEQIKKAQDPEITTMSGWLTSWGEEVPQDPADAGGEGSHGMDHSGHDSMPGMMSDKEMGELEKLSGEAFDAAFLRMMVEHHEGAVDMATTERSEGAYQPAKDLAKAIVTAQTDEIAVMNDLLDG
ncbi:copper resistance protein [Wenjunlia vitaminophila]|uniref:Copper resistance protein n=1 Tax=Wenjunlia vitaminophila TaxID=76728 RepID=A0A0T6LSE6_WENVI|nr:DUF305 domain-containing protein [Wenjunlia vitaminophila]KRV49043.1 copper resistance protein [Wenjunlia vitaminophila]